MPQSAVAKPSSNLHCGMPCERQRGRPYSIHAKPKYTHQHKYSDRCA